MTFRPAQQLSGAVEHYLVRRELSRLARKRNFSEVKPERVLRALETYAASGMYVSHGPATGRWLKLSVTDLLPRPSVRRALATIWQHARERVQNRESESFKWARIMACCNALTSHDRLN